MIMRKLVAITGILVLAACGGEAETVAEGTSTEAVAEVPAVVGTYVGTDDDGAEWTGVIKPDGTTEVLVAGEVVETGTWRSGDNGTTCFTANPAEGEEAEPESCMTFGEVQADGTVEVTDSNGETDTLTKTA
jgi:hypothetical protein